MSIEGILSSGLSSIMTNTAALRVTADNIANVDTPGYVRRVVHLETLVPSGQVSGVKLGDIERTVNLYFDREVLSANGGSARFKVQSDIMNQLNAALGQPGDGNSLGSQLDAVYAALAQASLDPSSLSSRLGVLSRFDALAQTISGVAGSVALMRSNADQQVSSVVDQANTLIKQIYDLNPQIQHAFVGGDTATGLLDERDLLVQKLSELIGVRTVMQSDGRLFVATTDGLQLVADNYAQLTYSPSVAPSFSPVTVQTIHGLTDQPLGNSQNFDPHASTGQLRGLLDIRDNTLIDIGAELSALARSVSLAFNEAHNANASVPPLSSLIGRRTGLLGTDALNFSGATTIGIADNAGSLVHRIAIDFDAGTLSVDGGPTSAMGGTVASFVTALDTALGANGDASFANGVMTVSATGGNGLVVADDTLNPSSRGGLTFSHFFGLNDLFEAAGNSVLTTGLSSGDLGGFAPGGEISLLLKGPRGERVAETTVAVTGTTIGDMVTALNTAFAGKASFALDANGELQVTNAGLYSAYNLEVKLDTTARGGTGQSFTSLFGIGTGQAMAGAQSFRVASDLQDAPQRLAFAKSALTSSTVLGSNIAAPGDNRGLLALQDIINRPHVIEAAGALPLRNVTFGDYAAAFYQDVGARDSVIEAAKNTETTRLDLAKRNQSEAEGVNIDEELEHMMILQQAYNAGTRLIRLAEELYDELMSVVGG